MKRLLSILLLALMSMAVTAQKETDFALHFMKMYAQGTSLTCKTVSPTMMSAMLQSDAINKDKDTESLLRQIRSIRTISNDKSSETQALHEKAETLIKTNKGRYQLYDTFDGKNLYTLHHRSDRKYDGGFHQKDYKHIKDIHWLAPNRGALKKQT